LLLSFTISDAAERRFRLITFMLMLSAAMAFAYAPLLFAIVTARHYFDA